MSKYCRSSSAPLIRRVQFSNQLTLNVFGTQAVHAMLGMILAKKATSTLWITKVPHTLLYQTQTFMSSVLLFQQNIPVTLWGKLSLTSVYKYYINNFNNF
jgi:hypothetical protein